jgi:hypothetical protein
MFIGLTRHILVKSVKALQGFWVDVTLEAGHRSSSGYVLGIYINEMDCYLPSRGIRTSRHCKYSVMYGGWRNGEMFE